MIADGRFSDKTLDCLAVAGWYPGRRIATEPFLPFITKLNCVMSSAADSFLAEFGELNVRYMRRPRAGRTYPEDEIRIHPKYGGAIDADDYPAILASPVCPLGDCFRAHMVLMMIPSGEVFAAFDDSVIRVGNSGAEAIEALCSDVNMPNVYQRR